MANKRPSVVVTGANRGIGLEAASQFATAGFDRVLLTYRSEAKGEAAIAEAAARSGRPRSVFAYFVLDLVSHARYARGRAKARSAAAKPQNSQG